MPSELQLIHSGRLSEGKGTFLFVDVCAELKKKKVSFQAHITGGADEATYARLKTQIESLDLTKEVLVRGRISDAELLETLKASDVLIHLSRIDSYPLIVLEAMTCSVLPVCLELAGARHMIETYDGFIINEKNPVEETVELLAKLKKCEIQKRAGLVAARVKEDYSWDNCAGALEAALNQC
jgi:glycosyltransferase involved in cell wall biosynthesis